MKIMLKQKLILLLFLLLFFIHPNFVHAANSNFSTTANVTYTVYPSGITHVVFAESLTNLTDKFYATSYKIHLGFNDIQNLVASDNGGAIVPSLVNANEGEDVAVTFNNPAFGKNKSTSFTFSFDTKEVATANGSIWEVNIPGLSNASDFTSFTVHVVVPSYFGSPTYMKPNVGNGSLNFTKDQLGESGISLAFGDKQVYSFHLTYNLQNTQVFPVQTEIALPPNTNYQHIEIDNISPRPSNVTEDTDGNWLAQYFLKPSQILKVTTAGKAFISLNPSREALTQNQFSLYTRQNAYWQVNDSKIQTLARQLKTPEAIFDYVVKTLHYDFARISDTQDRLGAVGVLLHPDQAVCLEFTDLFIALSRAAGIPARELDGYGYTQNSTQRPLSLQKEILHAWPEYYDTSLGEWVMVDPTWENTTGGVDYFHTFDFDHVTLVVKGLSSTYPVPAGGYKLPGQENEKDVAVTFAENSVEPLPSASTYVGNPLEFTAGFPITPVLSIENAGSVLFPPQLIQANFLGATDQVISDPIPPFGHTTVSMNFGKSSFLTNTTNVLTIRFAGQTIAKSIRITAFSLPVILGGGIILATIFSIIISLIARRSRRLPISR